MSLIVDTTYFSQIIQRSFPHISDHCYRLTTVQQWAGARQRPVCRNPLRPKTGPSTDASPAPLVSMRSRTGGRAFARRDKNPYEGAPYGDILGRWRGTAVSRILGEAAQLIEAGQALHRLAAVSGVIPGVDGRSGNQHLFRTRVDVERIAGPEHHVPIEARRERTDSRVEPED